MRVCWCWFTSNRIDSLPLLVRPLKHNIEEFESCETLVNPGSLPQTMKSFYSSSLQSFGIPFIRLEYVLWTPLKWFVIFLQSWTSTGYLSNSTGSFVTDCRFSPIIVQQWLGRFLGINWLRSYCLQVQPVTCWHPPVLLCDDALQVDNEFKESERKFQLQTS